MACEQAQVVPQLEVRELPSGSPPSVSPRTLIAQPAHLLIAWPTHLLMARRVQTCAVGGVRVLCL
eukprot:3333276-Rhodomonas_salina.2